MKTDVIDKTFANLAPGHKQRTRWLRRPVGFLILAALVGSIVYAYAPQYVASYLPQAITKYLPQSAQSQTATGRRAGPRGNGPVPVLVAGAHKADVPLYFDGVGSSRALNNVTVNAQVDGKLMSVNFKEGQDVERDFVLAEIEPAIYQAQFDQAVAKKGVDEAQLGNARLDLDRYARLSQTNAATRQQYDTQKALVAQLEAQVRVDQAAIDNAKATLSFTKIVAPLAGRTGIRLVDPGNIVHAADTTGIVVITQIRPIAVIFTLPQQELAQVNKAMAGGRLSVQALGDDNRSVVDRGTLQVVDNQVDPTTGTVKLKAEFPNVDLQLWPGQFVNVKLLVDTLHDVIVVPSAAVQRGPNGTFVYVAGDDKTVAVHSVTVAKQDEAQAVISDGVADGERVVTTGFAQLADGAAITIGAMENLERPAGSERRRGPPRGPASAKNDETPPAVGKPGDTAVTPAVQPVNDVTQPVNGIAQPANGAAQPANGADQPAKTAPQPADAVVRPAERATRRQRAGG